MTLEERRGIPVARLFGEIDIANVPGLGDRLLIGVPSEAPGLVIDLTETEYLDSSGIKLLFQTAATLRARGQELRIAVAEGSFIAHVLTVTGLHRIVPLDPSLAEAVEALSPVAQ